MQWSAHRESGNQVRLSETQPLQPTNNQEHYDDNADNGEYYGEEEYDDGQYDEHGQYHDNGHYDEQYDDGEYYDEQGQYDDGQYGEQGQYDDGQYDEQGQYDDGQYGEQGHYDDGQYDEQGQYDDEQYGDEQYGDEQHGDEQYGDEEYGDEEYGDDQYGDEQYGDEQHGDEQYGDEQYGDDQYGDEGMNQREEVYEDDPVRQENLAMLYSLCANATADNPESWEKVKEWIETHSPGDAECAAEQQGDSRTNPLHVACRNRPPLEIVEALIAVAPDIVGWPDTNGWIPLHYACGNGASEDILELLVQEYPESTVYADKRGRTPLHFVLASSNKPATPDTVFLLSDGGAAACADESGMLPIHYACAYGCTEQALKVLTETYPDSIMKVDKTGRSPLHFALGNCDRPSSPAVVKLLITLNTGVVNIASQDTSQLPLHVLAARASTIATEERKGRDNAAKCLELYLNAKPVCTADFLTALQNLPQWLSDIAVVTPWVQEVLNKKISQRFPTSFLMLDFIFLLMIIVAFTFGIEHMISEMDYKEHKDGTFSPKKYTGEIPPNIVISILYICAIYFIVRESVQIMSLVGLGLFKTWLSDPGNWLDVLAVTLVVFWTIKIHSGNVTDMMGFRAWAAFSLAVFWASVLFFLKSTIIDFAVFIGGVVFVVQRLAAFLMALSVILLAFAMMFVTVFQESNECAVEIVETDDDDQIIVVPVGDEDFPFCRTGRAIITVYTMLLGEVQDSIFYGSNISIYLFVAFMFLVVILLANVLIAIVTDSYGVIKNQRAAIVFWSNRLDFVAEMDAIKAGPWKKKVGLYYPSAMNNDIAPGESEPEFGRETWATLIGLFEDQSLGFLSLQFFAYLIIRSATLIFIVFVWLPLGLISAGWLWPPQVREYLFQQKTTKTAHNEAQEVEKHINSIESLRRDVKSFQDEIGVSMASDRKEMVLVKAQLMDMREDMADGMETLRQMAREIVELRSQNRG